MTSKVFIINEPLRRNPTTGHLEKFLPMDSAAKFGEVFKVLPNGSPPADLGPYLVKMREVLATFAPDDFLVCVGHQPLLIAAAAMVGAKLGGGTLKVLQWDSRDTTYVPVALDLGIAE